VGVSCTRDAGDLDNYPADSTLFGLFFFHGGRTVDASVGRHGTGYAAGKSGNWTAIGMPPDTKALIIMSHNRAPHD